MTTKALETYTATIYVGMKERESGRIIDIGIPERAIQKYVDTVGLCVTQTNTKFRYTNGFEQGLIIGLINYPRFPSTPGQIKAHALALAESLLKCCEQKKVTVVLPDETIMLSTEVE